MASVQIFNLYPVGSELCKDSESFMMNTRLVLMLRHFAQAPNQKWSAA